MSDMERDELKLELQDKGIGLKWQDVSSDIKFKKLGEARSKVREISTHLVVRIPSSRSAKQIADCHYHLGRISLEEGNRIGALWAFFNALCENSSHKKVNEEIDLLEVSMQWGNDLENCVIQHNIRYILADLRYKIEESPRMDQDRMRELRDAFGDGRAKAASYIIGCIYSRSCWGRPGILFLL